MTGTYAADCAAMREVLDLVGDTWSVMIIVTLGECTTRFSELKRSIDGISQRMLTVTLRKLERDGLVARRVHPTNPPSVDYTLTRLGTSLVKPVSVLATWAWKNRPAIERSRELFQRRAT